MTEVVTTLSEEVFNQLQKEPFVLLHTIDADSGSPTSSAISWIYAPNDSTLRFAIDGRSRLSANMTANAAVSVTVFAPSAVQTVYGKAKLVTDALEDVPFKLVCFDIEIEVIRDAMFYGARLSSLPQYEKTYDLRAAEKLDGQVFAAMKKA
ncbi:pyridoxamine 5'-phosphate oxidase family protein [Paenibacillus oenotherae]|uniref:Pyridoxamine 5'-phosphate oxidase family protein n=1 Tax=Paenibacillus oenotherae TaxID=1435645 RepID=A0ABS7D195_9BACL|nr:pyridoxamine 5'-phosphate oxidase family protein [Paenibacillus oenotherae]MBW7473673.1 pyridoxamine 5'-phosphate oxidase family protein [Paenibacillus oenotherae]